MFFHKWQSLTFDRMLYVSIFVQKEMLLSIEKKENNMAIENTDKINNKRLLIFYAIKT